MTDYTTDEVNNRNRLEFLEGFVKKMCDYLDNGNPIEPHSFAHAELRTVCGRPCAPRGTTVIDAILRLAPDKDEKEENK